MQQIVLDTKYLHTGVVDGIKPVIINMKKPKITAGQINIHKVAAAAAKHLAKLPPNVRKQMGSLAAKHLDYNSIMFHRKVSLPHQKFNLKNWGGNTPVMKC
jgi:hypothetical protein